MVELLTPEVAEYLTVTQMASVYVASNTGELKHIARIGSSIDLMQTAEWLRKQHLQLDWVLWCEKLEDAQWLAQSVAEFYVRPSEPVVTSLSGSEIIELISDVATRSQRRVADHDYVIGRATALAKSAHTLLQSLQQGGQLRDFNAGYRAYRKAEEAKGHKIEDYRILFGRLRVCLIRALVFGKDALRDVGREFPWMIKQEQSAEG